MHFQVDIIIVLCYSGYGTAQHRWYLHESFKLNRLYGRPNMDVRNHANLLPVNKHIRIYMCTCMCEYTLYIVSVCAAYICTCTCTCTCIHTNVCLVATGSRTVTHNETYMYVHVFVGSRDTGLHPCSLFHHTFMHTSRQAWNCGYINVHVHVRVYMCVCVYIMV